MDVDPTYCSWWYMCMATFSSQIFLYQAEVDLIFIRRTHDNFYVYGQTKLWNAKMNATILGYTSYKHLNKEMQRLPQHHKFRLDRTAPARIVDPSSATSIRQLTRDEIHDQMISVQSDSTYFKFIAYCFLLAFPKLSWHS